MGDTARIGVIGAGWWAVVNHIPVLQGLPDCAVVAVNRLGAEELAAVHGADPSLVRADIEQLVVELGGNGVLSRR